MSKVHVKGIHSMLKKKKDTGTECNARAKQIDKWFLLSTDSFSIAASKSQRFSSALKACIAPLLFLIFASNIGTKARSDKLES